MGKEKVHVSLVVIGHVDAGKCLGCEEEDGEGEAGRLSDHEVEEGHAKLKESVKRSWLHHVPPKVNLVLEYDISGILPA